MIKIQILNCKMQNQNLKSEIFKKEFFYGFEKVAQINQEIYQERKGEDSSGSFRFGKAKRKN